MNRPNLKSLIFTIVLLFGMNNLAAIEVLSFSSPEQEQRYKDLIAELRCLVCQNQSLADSNAELAQDLRHEVYGMIMNGQSNKEITDFLIARYSDFVLYRPPLRSSTILLWFAPAILIIVALAFLFITLKRRSDPSTEKTPPMSAEDQSRLNKLLKDNENTKED